MPRKKNINKKVQGSQEYVPIRPFYKQSHLDIFQLPYVGNIEEKTSEIDSLILFHTKKTFNGFWWQGGREKGAKFRSCTKFSGSSDWGQFSPFFPWTSLSSKVYITNATVMKTWWLLFCHIKKSKFLKRPLEWTEWALLPTIEREERGCIFISSGQ